jgi:hypothetical protein
MAEETEERTTFGTTEAAGWSSDAQSPLRAESTTDTYEEMPHVFAGAAFAGGFLLAQILKRIGGHD